MFLLQEVRDGTCFVQLHLDPGRKADPFSAMPRIKVLHGLPGAPPAKDTVSLAWKNADLLEAAIPIVGRETVLNTVEVPGQQAVTLQPVCLPYSPEFAPDQPGRGAAALAQIATTTGGKDRVEIPKIWNELPVKSRYVELAPWLLILAAMAFLLEVLERRTGWVSKFVVRKPAALAPEENTGAGISPAPAARKPLSLLTRKPSSAPAPAPTAKSESPRPVAPGPAAPAAPRPPASAESAFDALRRARERARSRTDKDR
jgi:hypothetical protein